MCTVIVPKRASLAHDRGDRYLLTGDVNFDNAGTVVAAGKRHFKHRKRIVVDLGVAGVASTAGLAVLLEWANWCAEHAITLTYERTDPRVLAVAELNGVATLLPLSTVDTGMGGTH